ncbi:MAG: hypothetical protein K2X90_01505 [Candidatus Babeliaceae bacterium]|nr:hypothetical protein [Candidatus Babeliaceae bacterium]
MLLFKKIIFLAYTTLIISVYAKNHTENNKQAYYAIAAGMAKIGMGTGAGFVGYNLFYTGKQLCQSSFLHAGAEKYAHQAFKTFVFRASRGCGLIAFSVPFALIAIKNISSGTYEITEFI